MTLFLNNAGVFEDIIPIVLMSLRVSVTSSLLASSIGIASGIYFSSKKIKFKRTIIRITDTLMSLPPVLMGLLVYLLLSKSGPLGSFKLLFTPAAMIIAQSLLILPIVFGLTVEYFSKNAEEIRKVCFSLGASRKDVFITLICESRSYLMSIAAVAFGRAISEVGAVMMVGGNIKGHTRVMTTYIALETGKGNFSEAIIIGVTLLCIAFLINFALNAFKGGGRL